MAYKWVGQRNLPPLPLTSALPNLPQSKTSYDDQNSWHKMYWPDMVSALDPPPPPRPQPIRNKSPPSLQPQRSRPINLRENHNKFWEDFDQRYRQLHESNKYRYPNDGQPKAHVGRSGGSWRHVREVQGLGTSKMTFVDGLVSNYDNTRFLKPHLEVPASLLRSDKMSRSMGDISQSQSYDNHYHPYGVRGKVKLPAVNPGRSSQLAPSIGGYS